MTTRRRFLATVAAVTAGTAGCSAKAEPPEPAIYADYTGPGYTSRDIVDVEDPEGWVDDVKLTTKVSMEYAEDVGEWEENGGPSPTPPGPGPYSIVLDLDFTDADLVPTTLFVDGESFGIKRDSRPTNVHVESPGRHHFEIVSEGFWFLPGLRLTGPGFPGTDKRIGEFWMTIGEVDRD